MSWIEEIAAIAEACGYKYVYVPDRGGTEVVAVGHTDGRFVTHIGESVWNYLKSHGDAEQWLTLWLEACNTIKR